MNSKSAHTFHIPVMGISFTIDTPLQVAKYGISSVISLVDDVLIEQMRKFHCEKNDEPYKEITNKDDDPRAGRITAYLNLIDRLVKRQVCALQTSPFDKGSEITRYYEMLPETPLKQAYSEMLATEDPAEKARLQENLRGLAVPGSIDVNIMTKLDRPIYRDGKKQTIEFNDAMSALRGYAGSTLCSSIVLSAGMNQALYSYASQFEDFLPDKNGIQKKKIVLKVSDYRSAIVQGKFLAKRGLWISELRIESGLNCGGHAFATKGLLMGPILEEFKEKREELFEVIRTTYLKACAVRKLSPIKTQKTLITVQGGIGTVTENEFLLKYYEVDGTGWATPFLLVPDVVNVDDELLKKLAAATEREVYLSNSSPMGIPFWNLRNSASEEARRERIRMGEPGSSCPKRFIALNTEFTEVPICISSRSYQKFRLESIGKDGLSPEQLAAVRKNVLEKSCICHDLGGSVKLKHGIETDATPAVCCGPNLAFFSRIIALEEMVSHIYGRLSLLKDTEDRMHMFVQELKIYIEHLRKEAENLSLGLSARTETYCNEFKENLLQGIKYYKILAKQFVDDQQECFISDLEALHRELNSILPVPAVQSVGAVPG